MSGLLDYLSGLEPSANIEDRRNQGLASDAADVVNAIARYHTYIPHIKSLLGLAPDPGQLGPPDNMAGILSAPSDVKPDVAGTRVFDPNNLSPLIRRQLGWDQQLPSTINMDAILRAMRSAPLLFGPRF